MIAVSFAAGLNVYVTVATLGLLSHTRFLDLPPSLHFLSNWGIIVAALILFGVNFFVDKIPALDLVWNALHTFIRVPVAALLAFQATAGLTPAEQLAATLAGGAIAFIAHGGKTAVRAAVTHSPEPFSNIALSLSEDGLGNLPHLALHLEALHRRRHCLHLHPHHADPHPLRLPRPALTPPPQIRRRVPIRNSISILTS